MRRVVGQFLFLIVCVGLGFSQAEYKTVAVIGGGTISGAVKWSGTVPHSLDFPVIKDEQICDPDSKKTVDLERLVIGPDGGVANTVVYLKDITTGKAMACPSSAGTSTRSIAATFRTFFLCRKTAC